MDIRNQPNEIQQAALLRLTPLILPAWTTPVKGYDGGISVRAVEGGLRFVIDPWQNMEINDEVRIYAINDTAPVWRKTIEAGEENKRVNGVIDAGYIVRGDLDALWYTIKRVSQEPQPSTPKLKLLVKLDRPGGFDDDYNIAGHSHLLYKVPQEIIDNGIDPAQSEKGVPITILPYPFMRVNDQIILIYGSERIIEIVKSEQVEDPGHYPLIVTINKATIEKVGDGARIPVSYQVVDEVGNYPDERSPWSATTHLLVDLKQNRLDAPIVIEADEETDVIDLEILGDKNVNVVVNTTGGAFKRCDTLSLIWIGTPAEGSQVVHGPVESPVERVGIPVSFAIPNSKIKAIAKGRASVAYTLKSDESTDRPSKIANVSVAGQINHLLAPEVREATSGQLPADAPQATVSVPYYTGRRLGDLITVHWEGERPGGGDTYFPIRIIVANEPEGKPIERSVPAIEISPLDGGSVKVHYSVANEDVMLNSVRNSLPLNLIVGAALPELQQPDVIQADSNNVLLPENAPGGAEIIAPFTGTLPGDTVGLRWLGSISGAHPLYEFPLTSHTAGHPVPFLVQPSYILANRNGEVDVSYYVKRERQPIRNSRTRTLSIGFAQVKWTAPTVLEEEFGQLDPNMHKAGFTVRVPTTQLQEQDGIDLIVDGRPGEGSIRPERRYVSGTEPVDFLIAASITGANIGDNICIHYDVIRGSKPLPSEQLTLRIGTLQNLPMPHLEGFDGNVVNLSDLRDNTCVLCHAWPFQLRSAPVWVSYVERRSDGTLRRHIPTSGTPNNQIEGLAVAAELQWLRECREGSALSIELKVGLFKAATFADAVDCPPRIYAIRSLFKDLTTFSEHNHNGWRSANTALHQFLVTESGDGFHADSKEKMFGGSKYFKGMKLGDEYEISFDYLIQEPGFISITIAEFFMKPVAVNETNKWLHFKYLFTNAFSSFDLSITINSNYSKVDSICLMQTG